jgi:hypothetical protein
LLEQDNFLLEKGRARVFPEQISARRRSAACRSICGETSTIFSTPAPDSAADVRTRPGQPEKAAAAIEDLEQVEEDIGEIGEVKRKIGSA